MKIFWRGIAVGILSAGTVAACLLAPSANLDDSAGVFMDGEEIRELPKYVLDYIGHPSGPGERELELLPDDTKFAKMTYLSEDRQRVASCHIVLAGADARSIHRPEICLPSQGWTIRDRFVTSIPVSGKPLEATVLLVSREQQDEMGNKYELLSYNLYWFVGKDLTTASHKERILRTALDNVFRNVNHRWAYVTVSIPIAQPHGLVERDATLVEASRLIEEIVPQIHRDW